MQMQMLHHGWLVGVGAVVDGGGLAASDADDARDGWRRETAVTDRLYVSPPEESLPPKRTISRQKKDSPAKKQKAFPSADRCMTMTMATIDDSATLHSPVGVPYQLSTFHSGKRRTA